MCPAPEKVVERKVSFEFTHLPPTRPRDSPGAGGGAYLKRVSLSFSFSFLGFGQTSPVLFCFLRWKLSGEVRGGSEVVQASSIEEPCSPGIR